MDLDDALGVIHKSSLADHAHRLVPHLLPGVRLRASRNAEIARAVTSRFGGEACLPKGTDWPMWDSSSYHRRWIGYWEGRMRERPAMATRCAELIAQCESKIKGGLEPLTFLAMVRLADVFASARLLGLPQQGVLLFFYDVINAPSSFLPEAAGGWRVFYADEAELLAAAPPSSQLTSMNPCRLVPQLDYTLAKDLRSEYGDERLCIHTNKDYAAVHAALLGGPHDANIVHRLRGAAQEVQGGLFLQCQLAWNGVTCGRPEDYQAPRAQELTHGATDWGLLLEIDSDVDGPGWTWGDNGRLYFCVREDDLARESFDTIWCARQCY
jgi:hypothetical protein